MESFDAISLVFISLGAFLLPLLGKKIKIPGIVLEIAYGIIVGPILNLVSPSEFISGLAILGFLLLMFLSGFEIEIEKFQENGLRALLLPSLMFLGTVLISLFLVTRLNYPIFWYQSSSNRFDRLKGSHLPQVWGHKYFQFVQP